MYKKNGRKIRQSIELGEPSHKECIERGYCAHLNNKTVADVLGAGTTVDDRTDTRARWSSRVLHSLRRLFVVPEANASNRLDSVVAKQDKMVQGVGEELQNVTTHASKRILIKGIT